MTPILRAVALLAFLAFPVYGQAQPDTPAPRPEAVEHTQLTPRFWDRQGRVAAGATVGLLAWDSAQTCHNLATGGRERWVNSQRCGVIVSTLALERIGAWSLAYLAHRRGWHKTERTLEWVGPTGNAAGISYSLAQGKPKPLELVCTAIKPGFSNCRIAPE